MRRLLEGRIDFPTFRTVAIDIALSGDILVSQPHTDEGFPSGLRRSGSRLEKLRYVVPRHKVGATRLENGVEAC
jgi:hypothetical protein